jgi:LEA14-like dessication related protein
MRTRRAALLCLPALLAGCAAFPGQEPLRVKVVDLQAMEGEALELRFLCVLRVQNPNDAPVSFNGVSLDLQVRGKPFASGVSDTSGTVPRFGELLVSVPLTASALDLARLAIGLFAGDDAPRVDYVVRGSLGSTRFEASGELALPASLVSSRT